MTGKIKYEFTAKIWRHYGQSGWHFVSLPQNIASEIRTHLQSEEEGWGRLKAVAKIKNSQWETSIWFDTKHQTYLLPIKAEIRKKEKLDVEQTIQTTVWI